MSKEKVQDIIVKMAAEVGSKTAIDVFNKQKEKEKKRRVDRRLRDTKRLMRSYKEIKIHAGDAITTLSEMASEDYEFFKDLMEDTGRIDVEAIIRSKARSAIMLTHIDAMLQAYEIISCTSKKPEDKRRYHVLVNLYLKDDAMTVKEIAEMEHVDISTIYKDIDIACEKMSALLFGIQWIERE